MQALDRIFQDIKSYNDEHKLKAATELFRFVTQQSNESAIDVFVKLLNDINKRVFELIHSSESNDKVAGILAIDKLVDFGNDRDLISISRFASYLKVVLPATDPQIAIYATRALGI